MRFSIFRKAESEEVKYKRWRFIHYSFKPYIVLPLLRFCERFLKKQIIKGKDDIPLEPYNINAKIFHDTLHESLKEWWYTFKLYEQGPEEHKASLILTGAKGSCIIGIAYLISFQG